MIKRICSRYLAIYLTFCLFLLGWHLPASAQMLTPSSVINYWDSKSFEVTNTGTARETIRLTTKGDGSPSFIGWELPQPVNMKEVFVEAYIKIQDLESCGGIELRLSNKADQNSYIAIQLPFFTDPLFNWVQPGGWLRITLTMGEAKLVGSPDITKINKLGFYINDSGSPDKNTPFSVELSGVAFSPVGKTAFMSITFDDGIDDHLLAAQIMHNHGLRGTAYIMPDAIGQPGFLKEEDLSILYNTYHWGISSHGSIPFTEFAPGGVEQHSENVLGFLKQRGFGFSSSHMAYPLGRYNLDYVLPIISKKFTTARIASGGAETFPPADWKRLRVVNVIPSVTAEMLKERIEKAKIHKEWIILMFHHLVEGEPQSDLEYNFKEFEKVMKAIKDSQIKTLPIHEMWEIHRVD